MCASSSKHFSEHLVDDERGRTGQSRLNTFAGQVLNQQQHHGGFRARTFECSAPEASLLRSKLCLHHPRYTSGEPVCMLSSLKLTAMMSLQAPRSSQVEIVKFLRGVTQRIEEEARRGVTLPTLIIIYIISSRAE